MKFLVLWHFDISRLSPEVIRAITQQPEYGARLEKEGKLECRYHVVGSHGGAWIYNVESNEELDRLLATSPVYNSDLPGAAAGRDERSGHSGEDVIVNSVSWPVLQDTGQRFRETFFLPPN